MIESNNGTSENVVRIYACGGAGTSIGARLDKYRNTVNPGFAGIDVCFVDTSDSNRKVIPEDRFYQVKDINTGDDKEGAGKIRRDVFTDIAAADKAILQRFKPGNLNIVISSASGGSGSVIAPILARELLLRDEPVIAIAVGSITNRLFAENTLNTLKTYEGLVDKTNKPVILFYLQMSDKLPQPAADQMIEDVVTGLAMLFSGQNQKLDSKDLQNWLNFTKTTSYEACLAGLVMLEKDDSYSESFGEAVSAITLGTSEGCEAVKGITNVLEYQCLGLLPDEISKEVVKAAPLHFITTYGMLQEQARSLNAFLADIKERENARMKRGGILNNGDSTNDMGFVL